jgi:hypothetical protein
VLLLQTTQAAPSGWDNLRDWISAVGSLAAAVVATVAFLWSLRGRRDRAWAELSHQARRVVAWVEWVMVQGPHRPAGALAHGPAVVIQNNSEEPIHDCVIRVAIASEHWVEVGSPEVVERRRIVPPGRTEIALRGLHRRDQSQLPALWFTDSAGLRWTRSHAGKLARVVDRDSMHGVSRWRRVLRRRRPTGAPAVVEEQALDAQDAEVPGSTGESPSTDK